MLRLYRVLRRMGILESIDSVLWFGRCFAQYRTSLYTVFAWAARRYALHVALVGKGALTFSQLEREVEMCASSLVEFKLLGNSELGHKSANSLRGKRLHLAISDPERLVVVLLAALRLGLEVVLHNPQQAPLERLTITDHTVFPKSSSPLPQTRGGQVVLQTSGSTGAPKLVRQRRIQPGVLAGLLERLEVGIVQKILLTVPLFHGHGLATLALSWLSGSALHVGRLQPQQMATYLAREQIDVLVLVPTILHRLLELSPNVQLQAIICGSAPLEKSLATRAAAQFGQVLFNLYGSTEAGLIALATPKDLALEPSSVGKPLRPIRLVEQQVVVGGFATGDLGKLERGFLFLLGRNDEMLICGGVNVYPHNLETQIGRLEYIKECAVLGVPDTEYGTAIHLFVVLHLEIPLETIGQEIAKFLPNAQRPKQIVRLEALPRTSLGKLQRHLLDSAYGKR